MKEGIVGYVVGFLVGKFGLPDKGLANGISGLTANCRECRVSLAGEAAGENGKGRWAKIERIRPARIVPRGKCGVVF